MRIFHGIDVVEELPKRSSCAIGVFDGVHRGHRKIIEYAVREARHHDLISLVVTFDPHPLAVVGTKAHPPLLTSLAHRLRLIGRLGVDACVVVHVTREFCDMEPEYFVDDVLVRKLRVARLYIGENFLFGRKRQGDAAFLEVLGKKYDFLVTGVALEKINGQTISSSFVRKLIEQGEFEKARQSLGRDIAILGTVVSGAGRGHIMGFPTANIDPHHEAIPPSGVYAVHIKYREKIFGGVVNIGTRPTFGSTQEPVIEAHIFEFEGSLYGEDLEIVFIEKLRDERPFPSKEMLFMQIQDDSNQAKKILAQYKIITQ
ncbi:MAG: bifunctional riboflavin kinase/FAD synthetase [Candidatus Omnitrophica bacterium]|nr:bifunctional riboflavin kinase/FAD synthetase [Candidatus Omnitrophota bacterium]